MNCTNHAAAGMDVGIAPSTARLYARDLRYLKAWRQAVEGTDALPFPAATLRRFVAEHLTGISEEVARVMISQGIKIRRRRWNVASLRRSLNSLAVAHIEAGLPNPTSDATVKLMLRRAGRRQAPRRLRPLTADLVRQMVDSCGDDPRGLRDRALLLVGFTGGGRRRSELVALRVEHLEKVSGGYVARLAEHKTAQVVGPLCFPIMGVAAQALDRWLVDTRIRSGAIFRRVTPKGRVLDAPLTGQTVNRIVKQKLKCLGYPEEEFGAHSLRVGFMTEAARQGVPILDALALTGHRNLRMAFTYYRSTPETYRYAARLLVDGR